MSRSTRIQRAFLIAVACALGLGCAAVSAAASPTQAPHQERTDPPKVDRLLERFPIGTETVKETENKTGSAVPPPAVTVPEEVSDSDSSQLTIAAVVGAVVLLMAVGTGLLVRRQRSRGAPIWSATANLTLLHETLATRDREWHKLQPAVHSPRRRPPVTEVPQERTEPKPGEPEQAGRPTSDTDVSDAADSLEHGGVVEQIGAILQSAEAAAAAIRAEAVAKAEEIARAAVEEGKRHLAKVEEEGKRHLAKVEEEAARIRNAAEEATKEAKSAAESYGATQRQEAEQSVRQMLARAEAQARAMRQASEGMARQIEEEAREREEKLRAQMRPLETSLRRALDAFRGITAQLEDLLDGEPPREDENLVDALSGSVQRTGDREEAPPQQERTNG
jgi:hypothetical protein